MLMTFSVCACVRLCVFSGFIWAEIKEMWDGGFTEYIHDWWNLMDFAMNSLYLATISLKIVAYVKVTVYVCVCDRERERGAGSYLGESYTVSVIPCAVYSNLEIITSPE